MENSGGLRCSSLAGELSERALCACAPLLVTDRVREALDLGPRVAVEGRDVDGTLGEPEGRARVAVQELQLRLQEQPGPQRLLLLGIHRAAPERAVEGLDRLLLAALLALRDAQVPPGALVLRIVGDLGRERALGGVPVRALQRGVGLPFELDRRAAEVPLRPPDGRAASE